MFGTIVCGSRFRKIMYSNENGIMVYYWCSRLLRHQCWTGVQLLGQIFQESLTRDGSKTEVGERGCNLQLVKLEKYSIQVLNSIKQYRIFWKILVKLEIFPNSPSTAENQKSLKPLPTFFQLKFTLTYLNVKRQNANRALLLQCKCNSMTSRCSSQSCWLSMLRQGPVQKRCQTMSNHVKPESLQCDLRQYIATGGCNHGKPTKIHEPNHTLPANRRLHILQLVGGFNKTEKYAYQIGSSRQVGIKIQNRWNHQIVNCLCNYIHHRSFTVKIRPFPTGSWALFRGKLAVKLRGGVLKHQQYWG